jgi:hypothetical protein
MLCDRLSAVTSTSSITCAWASPENITGAISMAWNKQFLLQLIIIVPSF